MLWNLIKSLLGLKPKKKKCCCCTPITVICPSCDWHGTVEQSMENDHHNDKCPICGESKLSYRL